ncbi:MAG: chemotaxis protein CheW [Desulfuromonadales bacterium]|nr:chemotaxis protein CheW [Desulfuromonadales bacterium]
MEERTTVKSQQYVTFCLDEELFGVEVSLTREILGLIPVTSVPQTPDYMLGVINLRGQVVPVVDMRLKLGMSKGKTTQDTCIIVIEVKVDDETLVVGALADAVREVLELNTDQIEPPPRLGGKLRTEYIRGMGKVDDQFMILLDIDRVFSSDELALVQDMGEMSLPEKHKEEERVEG